MILKFNTIDPLKKNYDLNKIDIDRYLSLSLVCYEWGKYQSNLRPESAKSESRSYLFKALNFINMWIGGSFVLMVHKSAGEKNRL